MTSSVRLPILDVWLVHGVSTPEKLKAILPATSWRISKIVNRKHGRKEYQVAQVSLVVGGTIERRLRNLPDIEKTNAIREEIQKLATLLADEDMKCELASE